ncbi:MAG TPA: hypothetical protein VND97_08410 [Beijerinckiaceae bacterium]|nr:hypothetical protein [Beijerinckiaceae bacterium]
MARQAMLLVADEIYYNLHGKAILQGIYHAELTIRSESLLAPQLIFFFLVETDNDDPFMFLRLHVALPGESPVLMQIPTTPVHISPGVKEISKQFIRWPLLVQAPILRPGRIEAKVIHDKGEIVVGAPWITYTGAATQDPPQA